MINMGKEYLTLKSWVQELLSENRVVPLKGQIVEEEFKKFIGNSYKGCLGLIGVSHITNSGKAKSRGNCKPKEHRKSFVINSSE